MTDGGRSAEERIAELESRILDLQDALERSEQNREVLETFCFGVEQEYKSAQEKLEQARRDLERSYEQVKQQKQAIQALGSPVIDIWDDVVTLPVVGAIDDDRAVHMTEKLLGRVAAQRARCVILDVTGVDVVDGATAGHLVKMIKATQLLGSYCVVTGIGPEVARVMVEMNVALPSVKTLPTLKEGLRDCMRHLGQSHRLVS